MADKVERADFNTDLPRRMVEVRSGEFAPEVSVVTPLTGPGDQVGRARFDADVPRRFVEVRPGEFAPEVVAIGLDTAVAAGGLRTPNAQTGNYTLVLSDQGKAVDVNSATAKNVTVPPNASVAFPVGSIIEVSQVGAGAVSLVAGGGVTLDGGLTTPAQGGSLLLRKRATNTWTVTSLAPAGTYAEVPGTAEKVVYVRDTGSDSNHGRSTDKAKLTFAAALAAIGAGNAGHIDMDGVVDLGAGASLSGHRCTFSGKGDRTILRVTGTQVGPALDFTGYLPPSAAQNKRRIGNFSVEGDNTVGTAKKGVVFGLGAAAPVGLVVHDIGVSKTGGAPWDFGGAELCDFVRLVANQPVGAYANDVPYYMATGACNGNRFIGCGLRSVTAYATVAAGSNGATLPQATINVDGSTALFSASGGTAYVANASGVQTVSYTGRTASSLTGVTGGTGTIATGDSVIAAPDASGGLVRFRDDGSFAPERNLFLAWWTEYLRLPTNGSIFSLAGNDNAIVDTQWFDDGKLTNTTNTSYVSLLSPSVSNNGGNTIRGTIPGRDTATTNIDYGVSVSQSRNHIMGTKGYRGYNVLLNSGVGNTFVLAGGSIAAASDPLVVDNSSQTTNIVIDGTQGSFNLTAGTLRALSAVLSTSLVLTNTGTTALHVGTEGGFAKLRIDGSGNLLWGSGGGAADASLSRAGAGRIQIVGQLEFASSDTSLSRTAAGVLAQGATNVLKTGHAITGSRPAASTAGKGAQFYDDTLSKPIWSDGTNWKDGAGNTV